MRVVLFCGLLGGVAASCAAQAYTPPPPPLTTLPPCPADKDAKKRAKRKDCDPTVYPSETVETKGKKGADATPAVTPPAGGTAADKFPFPGEQPAPSASAAKKFPFPGESAPAAESKPEDVPKDPGAATTTDTPAGRNYSFPGEDTRNVPHDAAAEKKATDSPAGKSFPYPGGGAPDASATKPDVASSGSSSGSSSSEPSSSSSDDGSTAAGKSSATKNPDDDDDDNPPKLTDKGSEGRRVLKVVKPQSDEARVDEDLSVAKFYGQSGNYMGAYLRAKDAVKTQPDYPEGHFALGEAAKRLKKKDEAAAEFREYLKLSPDGEKAKAAEKALAELQ